MTKNLFLFICAVSSTLLSAQFSTAVDSIHLNTLSAKVYANGLLTDVRSNTGTLIKSQGIWLVGSDQNNKLRLSEQQDTSTYSAFVPGPVSDDPNASTIYNKVYHVKLSTISNFLNQGGVIPQELADWPAHGNVNMGEAANLAPFIDANADGMYDPADGDYPDIKGDEALYVIFNDTNARSGGAPALGIEIHAMLYAYKTGGAADSILYREYTIYNRKGLSLSDAHLSTFVDFINTPLHGTNVSANAIYGYGAPIGQGQVSSCGLRIIENPLADYFDGMDNNKDGCLDGIINSASLCDSEDPTNGINENYLISGSMYYKQDLTFPQGRPTSVLNAANYMRGAWLDGSFLTLESPNDLKGNGNGDGYIAGSTNGIAHFFPGNSFDTVGAFSPTSPTNWFQSPLLTDDLACLANAGPFTIDPNEVMKSTFAISWATGDTSDCGYANINEALNGLDTAYANQPQRYVSLPQHTTEPALYAISYNQGLNIWQIQNNSTKGLSFQLYSLNGQLLDVVDVAPFENTTVLLQQQGKGIYILRNSTTGEAHRLVH
jgi:hypothetical protein